jgi:hypothetical protein
MWPTAYGGGVWFLESVITPPQVQWIMDGEIDCLDWNGVLPVECPHKVKVYCPLVYSPSEWVVHPLIVLEIMSVFDVSELLLLSKDWKLVSTSTLLFLWSAPSRLLCAAMDLMANPVVDEPTPLKPRLHHHWPEVEGLKWQGLSISTTKLDDA